MANIWTHVAPQLLGQTQIYSLAIFNGKLYGGTGPSAMLFEWNGSNAWIQKAPQLFPPGGREVLSLCVFNGVLYGGIDDGYILKWNGVDAWIQEFYCGKAADFRAMIVYKGKLYASTSFLLLGGGRLYRQDSPGNWTMVAPKFWEGGVSEYGVLSLAEHKEQIFGGTKNKGKLLRWNGVNAWVKVADQLLGQVEVASLHVFEDKLYGSTTAAAPGYLFEWNESNAWIQKTAPIVGQSFPALEVFRENKLLGGTTDLAQLEMWNGADAWIKVADQFVPETRIASLITFNNKIYGGTHPRGYLLEWTGSFPWAEGLLCCDLASSVGPGGECIPAKISSRIPYFSAVFRDPDVGEIGDNYRIQVNTDPDLTGTVMWDSGKTPMNNVNEGERCENLDYKGDLLKISVIYYWRIMFWDDEGHAGDWSEINCFEILVLSPYNLLCEQKTNPTNVTDPYPEFSAINPG